jgi:hypothetical protein
MTACTEGLFVIDQGADPIAESALWVHRDHMRDWEKKWFDTYEDRDDPNQRWKTQRAFEKLLMASIETTQRDYKFRAVWIARSIRALHTLASVCRVFWDLVPWSQLHDIFSVLIRRNIFPTIYQGGGYSIRNWRILPEKECHFADFFGDEVYRLRVLRYVAGFAGVHNIKQYAHINDGVFMPGCIKLMHPRFLGVSKQLDKVTHDASKRYHAFYRAQTYADRPKRNRPLGKDDDEIKEPAKKRARKK